jgi:hypothetical protein
MCPSHRSPAPPENPPTFPPSPGDVALCDLMPLSDVQAKSPFQTPLVKANVGVAGTCAYTSADESGDEVSIALRVQSLNSAKKAKAALDDARQAAVDHGVPVNDIDGLGDAAFSSGVDEVSVQAVVGNRLVTAKLQGEWPDTTDDAKVAAGTELVRTVISRSST